MKHYPRCQSTSIVKNGGRRNHTKHHYLVDTLLLILQKNTIKVNHLTVINSQIQSIIHILYF